MLDRSEVEVGDHKISAVLDGGGFLPTSAYRESESFDWRSHRGLLTEDGMLELALGGFLIRHRERLILVDAGVGPVESGTFYGGLMLKSLARDGISPMAITDVVLTHLHWDHIGWVTVDSQPIFSRARHWCHLEDWRHFVDGDRQPAALKMQPVRHLTELWSGTRHVVGGVHLLETPGHTPGSAIVVVASKEQRVLLLGDLVHCPLEFTESELGGIGDVDRDLARLTRERIAQELEASGDRAIGAHFPRLGLGRLLKAKGRRFWVAARPTGDG